MTGTSGLVQVLGCRSMVPATVVCSQQGKSKALLHGVIAGVCWDLMQRQQLELRAAELELIKIKRAEVNEATYKVESL